MTQAAILAASGSPGTTTGFKNRIINGNMAVNQYNTGTSVTSGFAVDRWNSYFTQSSKLTMQQNAGSVTPPAGFTNYLGVTSSSSYSITASDFFEIFQGIEGLNIADLGWGTANAKTVTLSFQVRSSLTGSFGGFLTNSANNRIYPFSYTISSANTWTAISLTIPGDTSGTWATNNTLGIQLAFGLGIGTDYNATANAWTGTSGNYNPTGSVSVVGTSGATWYITGVQLEVGTTATNFDFRSIGTELQLCQRYYETISIDETSSGAVTYGAIYNGSNTLANVFFKVIKRAAPTMTAFNYTNLPAFGGYTIAPYGGCYLYWGGGTGAINSGWKASAEL